MKHVLAPGILEAAQADTAAAKEAMVAAGADTAVVREDMVVARGADTVAVREDMVVAREDVAAAGADGEGNRL